MHAHALTVDDTGLRQGAHTHGTTHVVSEDEKGGGVGDEARVVVGNTVGDGTHGVLTHTETQVALGVLCGQVCVYGGEWKDVQSIFSWPFYCNAS